ncbi:hypothetical protein [Microbacterium deminutum]|uniref:Uncharacterized protein n=1 Tax=Microbacterium deminutum TaxID=344164 RepID=A0ABN2R1L8_9MICO
MTMPDPRGVSSPVRSDASTSPLLRAAIWVAIGALIAAAIVCVVWVLAGSQNGIVGRAFLTILLLVAFAGVAILDAHLAPRRPAWFALASMASWVAALLIGAVLIWMPERYSWNGVTRFVQFLFVVLILQLALLHIRLFVRASQRYVTAFTQTVAVVTIALVVGLAALLIVPLVLGEYLDFNELYWRIVVAVAILAAVGTALIPLVNVLFAPKRADPGQPAPAYQPDLLPWPMHVDGVTPLPMMPDGSPDWNAYYTGHPSPGARVFGTPMPHSPAMPPPGSSVASGPGYEGYPPPPPLPPRP